MAHAQIRLIIVGEGNSRQACLELLRNAGAEALAWLPGERAGRTATYGAMDLFVLPSLGEGISNTILEAMSTGLPVVATRVGGNVGVGQGGYYWDIRSSGRAGGVDEGDTEYYRNPALLASHGKAGRNNRNGLQHRSDDHKAIFESTTKRWAYRGRSKKETIHVRNCWRYLILAEKGKSTGTCWRA